MIRKALIHVRQSFASKDAIIEFVAEAARKEGVLEDKMTFVEAVYQREREISTSVGYGIAIPPGKTDVVPDCDLLRMEEIDENAPDAIGKLLIDLLRINSTDVIRAETLVADFHNCHLFLLNTLPYDLMDY